MHPVPCRSHTYVLVMSKAHRLLVQNIRDPSNCLPFRGRPPSPLCPLRYPALFGILRNNILTAEARHSMAFCTLLARRLILLNWKHNLPPSYTRWVKEVLHNLKLERLRFSLKGSLRKFDKIWNPLLFIIGSLDITPEESDV